MFRFSPPIESLGFVPVAYFDLISNLVLEVRDGVRPPPSISRPGQ